MRLFITILAIFSCFCAGAHELKCGADRLDLILPLVQDKRVGLVVNQTSVMTGSQVHLLDTLLAHNVNIIKIFTPEHGFRGDADAGEHVQDAKDTKTGLEIVSLYGANRRPKPESLEDIDVIVFDIQDVGARFYTYISTLYYVMQSCSALDKQIIVLDRPNPADYIDGPIIEPELRSFVGALPLPLLHGLTMGELARMIVGENWAGDNKVRLDIVPIKGWKHGQAYSLPIKPSPNLPNDQSIALYASLCLFEATKFSVGRGTYHPFEVIGYPDTCYGKFSFTPRSLVGFEKNPKHKDKLCYGLDLRQVKDPKGFTLKYLIDMMNLSPEGIDIITSTNLFDKLIGDSSVRKMLKQGKSEEQIKETWKQGLEDYKQMRKKYLLYE